MIRILAFLMLSFSCLAQDLDLRLIRRAVDPARTATQADTVTWYAGESLRYELTSLRGATGRTPIPAGSVAVWQVVDATLTNVWISASGISSSTNGGPIVFSLASTNIAMPAGEYQAYTFLHQTDKAGLIDRFSVSVKQSPGASLISGLPISQHSALAADVLALLAPILPTFEAWTNEAALRRSGDEAGSNYTDRVANNIQTQLASIAGSSGITGSVGRASSSDSALRLVSVDSNWWVSVDSGTATLWRATAYTSVVVTASSPDCDFSGVGDFTFSVLSGQWETIYSGKKWFFDLSAAAQLIRGGTFPSTAATLSATNFPLRATGTGAYTGWADYGYAAGAITNGVGTYTTSTDLAAAISNALASYNPAAATNALAIARIATNAAAAAQSSANSNAVSLAAATNLIIQTYLISSNAWITANWSNQTLQVSLVQTNGATNVVSVGGNDSIDPQATNLLWQAMSAANAGIAGKADKAWGKYAPDGSANPDPDYMTFLNSAATLFASGCSWSSYGTYAVMTSSGTVAFSTGTNGMWRIGPDSTNYIGYVMGGSVTVGAVPDSIHVYAGGASNGYAEIDYAYSGGDYPALWFTPSLAVDFTLLESNSVAWVDNLDGTATATVPAATASGFWKATTSATFAYQFVSTMPARFDGGVMAGTNALPVVYDSVIEISSGGATYRVPAQRK